MLQPIPYLMFNGNCADAMRFYERVLDGKLETVVRAAEVPCPGNTPINNPDMVMHARLALAGNVVLYAGDCPPHIPYEGIKGVSITLNYDSQEQAQRVFAALSEGGKVGMPMQPAFWAKTWGMVTDRFGIPWMVNGELLPVAGSNT